MQMHASNNNIHVFGATRSSSMPMLHSASYQVLWPNAKPKEGIADIMLLYLLLHYRVQKQHYTALGRLIGLTDICSLQLIYRKT